MRAALASFDIYKKFILVIQSSKNIMAVATILFATDTVYSFCIALFMIMNIDAKIRVHS
jgi:hypothetical protein